MSYRLCPLYSCVRIELRHKEVCKCKSLLLRLALILRRYRVTLVSIDIIAAQLANIDNGHVSSTSIIMWYATIIEPISSCAIKYCQKIALFSAGATMQHQ